MRRHASGGIGLADLRKLGVAELPSTLGRLSGMIRPMTTVLVAVMVGGLCVAAAGTARSDEPSERKTSGIGLHKQTLRAEAIKRGRQALSAAKVYGPKGLDLAEVADGAYQLVQACSTKISQLERLDVDGLDEQAAIRGQCCQLVPTVGVARMITGAMVGASSVDPHELSAVVPALKALGVTSTTLDKVRDDIFAKFGDRLSQAGGLPQAVEETDRAWQSAKLACSK